MIAALILMASAAQAAPDPVHGQAVFKQKCAACHTIDTSGHNGVGPNLFGVYGRAAALAPGYNYSAALKTSGVTWTITNLSAWLDKPSALVPRNKMGVAPPLTPAEKSDVLAFLKSAK